jgi:hypothetical protein
VACLELPALCHAHKVTCAAFITACNPVSQELAPRENRRRQDELAKELSQRSLKYVDGVGQHPTGFWFWDLNLKLPNHWASRWNKTPLSGAVRTACLNWFY